MSTILRELGYSARSLLKRPGTAFALLITIALGLGSNIVVLGFIHGFESSGEAASAKGVVTVLRVAAGLVFFIACANVASLLLGRATERSQPNSVRVALGASRARLTLGVISDSVVIAIGGGALSLLLARWTLNIVPALLFEEQAEHLMFTPDIASMIIACLAGVSIVILCGLLPLGEIRHDRPALVLRRESAGLSRKSQVLRSGMVTMQMACCCLLVIATGFLYAGFRAALRTGARADVTEPLVATVEGRPSDSPDPNYYREVERATLAVDRVSRVNWAARLPGSPPAMRGFRIEPLGMPRREVRIEATAFTPQSVRDFVWPPVSGRSFRLSDQGGCRAAIVNEAAAATLFGESPAPGRVIEDEAGVPVEIIGVLASRRKGTGPSIYFQAAKEAGGGTVGFRVPVDTPLARVEWNTNAVSNGYFASTGYTLVAGKGFDGKSSACRIAVLNREAADQHFAGKPIGAALIDDRGERTQIVGVVDSPRIGIFEPPTQPTVYFPMDQDVARVMMLIADAPPATDPVLLSRVKGAVNVKTLETHLQQTALAPLHVATALVSSCAAVGLLLGVIGLYGTISDVAQSRRRDLAIRLALGARKRDVIAQVVGTGAKLAVIGATVALLVALALVKALPPAKAPESWVWLAGPVLLGAVVCLASIGPARRALRLDPLRVLRSE